MENVVEEQLEFFENTLKNKRDVSSTFVDNMKLPIHRWYRYTAGFSAQWVNDVISKECAQNILDPFGGSGTVMVESGLMGVNSIGIEAQPYVYRIANAKLNWNIDIDDFKTSSQALLESAKKIEVTRTEYPKLISQCYSSDIIEKLESLKLAWLDKCENNLENKELQWFLITSILRSTSPVGTAQWQYIQPNKSKGKTVDVYEAYERKLSEIIHDINLTKRKYPNAIKGKVILEDARAMPSVPDKWADLVITSPPYANNYDYADATRLEMTFWDDIQGWGDLQDKVRKHLIVACTQHVTHLRENAETMLASNLLAPIKSELEEVYRELESVRHTKGGKKNYHLMILAYFYDLSQVFYELRRVTKENSKVCFVIGDSAPYGVYVPVDRWLGELAIHAGFNSYLFEKTRDRNIKWKNRKHTVPLHEGRLWIS